MLRLNIVNVLAICSKCKSAKKRALVSLRMSKDAKQKKGINSKEKKRKTKKKTKEFEFI